MESDKIEQLLESFDSRIPYAIYSDLNKEHKISKLFNKYDIKGERLSIVEKLRRLNNEGKEQTIHIFNAINDVYIENIEYGSKYVTYYQLDETKYNSFYNYSRNLNVDDTIISRAYPYMIDKDTLSTCPINEIHLVSKKDDENTLQLVYSRVIVYHERVKINPAELTNSALRDGFEEIYGVKKYKKQFVDIVCLNKNNRTLEIRIDYFKDTSDSLLKTQFNNFLSAYKEKIGSILGSGFFLRVDLNIHSVLKKMNADLSGRLVEIAFSTGEGSNIKIKKRRNDNDIRTEAYHKAGSSAVLDNLDIFRIGIVWKNNNNAYLELLIPGSSDLVHATTKFINVAIISNCKGAADFNYINSKIFHFLENDENL